jgi:hypothetical protein
VWFHRRRETVRKALSRAEVQLPAYGAEGAKQRPMLDELPGPFSSISAE